jgi:NIPSNAP
MIYEIRTYTIRSGTTAEVEKRFAEAYEVRKKRSPLAGFFHTEFGPLNEVVHIWPYESLEDRARIRAEAAKDEGWPPKIQEFILNQKVEIVMPFQFAPPWSPAKDGPIYELRQYTFRGGTLPDIQTSWEKSLPDRIKVSPIMMLGSVEFGPAANSFVHLWAYPSFEKRAEARAKAAATGSWPPAGGREHYLLQANKVMLPSSFSPAQ